MIGLGSAFLLLDFSTGCGGSAKPSLEKKIAPVICAI